MNLYQIAKTVGSKTVYITGALSYSEAVKKLNALARTDNSSEVTYTVELHMPFRQVEEQAAPAQQEQPAASPVEVTYTAEVEAYEARRIQYLDQFDDSALAQMCQQAGYLNQFTGEYEFATLEEVSAVFTLRAEREAQFLANEIAAPVSSVESDTVQVAVYHLELNGAVSEEHHYLNRWEAIYAAARSLQAAGLELGRNVDFLQSLYTSRNSGALVIAGDLEESTFSARLIPANN